MSDIVAEINTDKKGALVRFDGGETLWFSRAAWSERGLRDGEEIDLDELKRWLLPRQYTEALNCAVSLLAVRARSGGEVRRKLEERHYMEDAVEMALYKLEKEKLLDDEAFARDWAASRARRQVGKNRILQELRLKGVSRELAERAVEALDECESGDQAEALARKLLKKHKTEEPRKAMNKVMAALARRGYGFDEARRAVDLALDSMRREASEEDGNE